MLPAAAMCSPCLPCDDGGSGGGGGDSGDGGCAGGDSGGGGDGGGGPECVGVISVGCCYHAVTEAEPRFMEDSRRWRRSEAPQSRPTSLREAVNGASSTRSQCGR